MLRGFLHAGGAGARRVGPNDPEAVELHTFMTNTPRGLQYSKRALLAPDGAVAGIVRDAADAYQREYGYRMTPAAQRAVVAMIATTKRGRRPAAKRRRAPVKKNGARLNFRGRPYQKKADVVAWFRESIVPQLRETDAPQYRLAWIEMIDGMIKGDEVPPNAGDWGVPPDLRRRTRAPRPQPHLPFRSPGTMRKADVVEEFERYVVPQLRGNDAPQYRQAWNEMIDSLIREGRVVQSAGDWSAPKDSRRR